MKAIHQYVLAGLDLENKTILDAATGLGKFTRAWAEAIHAEGGTAKIISIDNDLSPEWKTRITKYLGDYSKYVDLREADIFDLGFLREASIDIINCADTLIFLNPSPLRLLSALMQFARILKPGGHLIITSELPLREESHSGEGQWFRWNLSKAIRSLKGKTWSEEVELQDIIRALSMIGFDMQGNRAFPENRRVAPESEVVINEWHKGMHKEIETLKWTSMQPTLRDAVDEIRQKVLNDGYLLCPAKFVLKCTKNRNGNTN